MHGPTIQHKDHEVTNRRGLCELGDEAVARALDPQAPLLEVGTAAVLSWVVGFVLVPVPGGVGVREAAFVAAAGSLDPGIAAAVALAARALFVLVDAAGAVIGSVALRRSGVKR